MTMTADTFQALKKVYAQMDHAWNKIAREYGFRCKGCKDNCCKSLFFHHTHVEKSYLRHGFTRLDPARQKTIRNRAEEYIEKTFQSQKNVESKKIMCPVNEDGLCLLYKYRPMICRLHGLPHELHRAGSDPVKGTGCEAGAFRKKTYIPFNRTPFYQQMAQIEMTFRETSGNTGKIKETVAHMLLSLR